MPASPEAPAPPPAAVIGEVAVYGNGNTHYHVHRGPPAQVAGADFRLENRGTAARPVTILRLELLHGHCSKKDSFSSEDLPISEVRIDDVVQTQRPARFQVPAGKTVRASLGFPARGLYNACERFAFRLRLRAGSAEGSVEVPLHIIREEPLRRPAEGLGADPQIR